MADLRESQLIKLQPGRREKRRAAELGRAGGALDRPPCAALVSVDEPLQVELPICLAQQPLTGGWFILLGVFGNPG